MVICYAKYTSPNYIIVASTTMGSMISLGINLCVVLLFGFFAHAHYTWRVLLVPFNIIQLYCLGLGVALLLASLFVYFRDVAHIWEVVLQAMFYATPIIYPISMVANNPEFSWAGKLLMLNPSTQVIMDIRHNLLSPEYVPTVWTMVDNRLLCLLPYVLSVFYFVPRYSCVPQVQLQVRGGALIMAEVAMTEKTQEKTVDDVRWCSRSTMWPRCSVYPPSSDRPEDGIPELDEGHQRLCRTTCATRYQFRGAAGRFFRHCWA